MDYDLQGMRDSYFRSVLNEILKRVPPQLKRKRIQSQNYCNIHNYMNILTCLHNNSHLINELLLCGNLSARLRKNSSVEVLWTGSTMNENGKIASKRHSSRRHLRALLPPLPVNTVANSDEFACLVAMFASIQLRLFR